MEAEIHSLVDKGGRLEYQIFLLVHLDLEVRQLHQAAFEERWQYCG